MFPSPINPLGAKGAGEGGIIAAGGIMANAVANALRDFGVEPRELPLSPPKIWEMVQAGRLEDGHSGAPRQRRTRNPDDFAALNASAWIPGSREDARPGMTA